MKTSIASLLFLFACTNTPDSDRTSITHTDSNLTENVRVQTEYSFIDTTKFTQYKYLWQAEKSPWANSLAGRIPVPEGYRRDSLAFGSFGGWLRHLPLAPKNTPVKYHNGDLKSQQKLHEAVIAIDVGRRDLQQCADAVMRLRAEYLYSKGSYEQIGFNFTNGDPAPFSQWQSGKKISIQNNRLVWTADGRNDASHPSFRRYMDQIFTYAGTASLTKELKSIPNLEDMQVGDVLIRGGFPGHAVLVVDMAIDPETGDKLFMIVQSYMPAQSIHILKNLQQPNLGVWYSIKQCLAQGQVDTPQWTFELNQLKRFVD